MISLQLKHRPGIVRRLLGLNGRDIESEDMSRIMNTYLESHPEIKKRQLEDDPELSTAIFPGSRQDFYDESVNEIRGTGICMDSALLGKHNGITRPLLMFTDVQDLYRTVTSLGYSIVNSTIRAEPWHIQGWKPAGASQ